MSWSDDSSSDSLWGSIEYDDDVDSGRQILKELPGPTNDNKKYDGEVNASNDDDSHDSSNQVFVVEFPPGGLDEASATVDDDVLQGEASSIAKTSFEDELALNRLRLASSSLSVTGSSISSFVHVSHAYQNSTEDNISTTSSSWFHVPLLAETSVASCQESTPPSQSASCDQNDTAISLSDAATISLVDVTAAADSDVDGTSVTSCDSPWKCRRCHFHNVASAVTCEVCHIALIPNPQTNTDQEVAHNLQRQEIARKDHQQSILLQGPAKEQATILADELHGLVSSYYADGKNGTMAVGPSSQYPFCPLPEADLQHHLMHFISMAKSMDIDFSRLSLGYKFVRVNGIGHTPFKVWNAIKSRGFAMDASVGFSEPIWVSTTLEGARRLMVEQLAWIGLRYHHSRFSGCRAGMMPIQEDNEAPSCPYWVWVVAVVESTRDQSYAMKRSAEGKVTNLQFPEQVLPLICFEETNGNNDEIRKLMNGLSRFLWGLVDKLNLTPLPERRGNALSQVVAPTRLQALRAKRERLEQLRRNRKPHTTRNALATLEDGNGTARRITYISDSFFSLQRATQTEFPSNIMQT